MATAEATPGAWFDCNNVRFRNGLLQPIGGNAAFPNAVFDGPPRDILTWHDNSYVRWGVIGTDTSLYAFNFSTQTLYVITPVGVPALDAPGPLTGYGLANYGEAAFGTARDPADIGVQDVAATYGDKWSMDTWGQDLLIVPTQDGRLYHWSPTTPTTLPAIVTAAPINNRGVQVTDQRAAVLIGAGGDPRSIAWSDQEDYTVWTPAVGNLAGQKNLQTQAYAMTSIKTAAGILIFTGNDVHMMSYVGPPYAYGITQLATGCGPASLRAPVAIGSTVIWPSTQSFWTWAGAVQPMPCDVGDWFFSLLSRGYIGRLFGSPNPTFSEMWWDWPDEGSQECNRYVAVNYAGSMLNQMGAIVPNRTWTIGVRARTGADPTGTMDFPILGGLLGSGGALFLHEYGWLENGADRAATGEIYAESGAITLGEGDQRFNVTQIVPDYASQFADILGYSFDVTEQPMSTADAYNTGLYTVVHDGLMDVRFSGRSVQMRVEALKDGDFAVGRVRLVMTPAGKR
ncbi:MAG TPA: hypothetical protein VGH84_06395 [Steroidobacteraceae bacterium]